MKSVAWLVPLLLLAAAAGAEAKKRQGANGEAYDYEYNEYYEEYEDSAKPGSPGMLLFHNILHFSNFK